MVSVQGESSSRRGDGLIAALDARHWWIEGELAPRERGRQITLAVQLFMVMRARGLGLLYVHPSALPTLGLPPELDVPRPGERRPPHPFLAGVLDGVTPARRALAPSIELEHPDGRLELLIGAYQDGAGEPFPDTRDGGELLAAALAYAHALEQRGRRWPLRNSPAVTGWNLMHSRGGGRATRRPLDGAANEHPELAGMAAGSQVEVPYGTWTRPDALEQPLEGGYVAAFDVNGQRLAACSRLALGIDGLEHRPQGLEHPDDAKLPGYHRVVSVRTVHAGAIPPIFELGWHTTPRVQMAAYLGLEPQVAESWVWREHLPYLDPFYNRMRAAREQLLTAMGLQDGATQLIARERAAAIALQALKRTYLEPFGRLRSHKLRGARDVRYRPAWYDAIIGQELARQYLRLHQLADAGEHVLAVYFDAIILHVPEPDYVPAALELSPQLGKFKRAGGVLPTAQALAALGESVSALVSALKAAGVLRAHASTPPAGTVAPAALSALTRPAHGGYPGQLVRT